MAGRDRRSAELSAFYSAVKATAADGLSASIRNETAYRTAAAQMLKLLGGLDAVDAASCDAAAPPGSRSPRSGAP